jgi:hypothetical protein
MGSKIRPVHTIMGLLSGIHLAVVALGLRLGGWLTGDALIFLRI